MSRQVKLVRQGQYAAEVEVDLVDSPQGWGPYLSAEDARKLDQVRRALRNDDLAAAGRLARVFRLIPITAAG